MDDWLRLIVRLVIHIVVMGIGWYIYQAHSTNLKKKPELAEEMNKQRSAQNLPPLTVEGLRRVVRKRNIISSVVFGVVFGIFVSVGHFLVDLLLG